MTIENLISIISKYSLTIRCLPHTVVTLQTYNDGDENRVFVNSDGSAINETTSVVEYICDLDYFRRTHTFSYLTPEQRLERWLKLNPSGRKKFLKRERIVEKGGWWYVKEVQNTDSTVSFNRGYDKFFAPTLEEAIQLYLDSLEAIK